MARASCRCGLTRRETPATTPAKNQPRCRSKTKPDSSDFERFGDSELRVKKHCRPEGVRSFLLISHNRRFLALATEILSGFWENKIGETALWQQRYQRGDYVDSLPRTARNGYMKVRHFFPKKLSLFCHFGASPRSHRGATEERSRSARGEPPKSLMAR